LQLCSSLCWQGGGWRLHTPHGLSPTSSNPAWCGCQRAAECRLPPLLPPLPQQCPSALGPTLCTTCSKVLGFLPLLQTPHLPAQSSRLGARIRDVAPPQAYTLLLHRERAGRHWHLPRHPRGSGSNTGGVGRSSMAHSGFGGLRIVRFERTILMCAPGPSSDRDSDTPSPAQDMLPALTGLLAPGGRMVVPVGPPLGQQVRAGMCTRTARSKA